MKVIATINFKGGVGKTTLTWLLAKYLAFRKGEKILVFDSDAQMSLTIALSVDEEKGTFYPDFNKWYNTHKKSDRTILGALDAYSNYAEGRKSHFDFPIDRKFIYEVSRNLFFVPSVTDLYWLELDVFKPEITKGFIQSLLGKIQRSHGSPVNPELVFFDCPPNFTALSYSILSNCSLILIPINPDVFASYGVRIMIEGLKSRIQPWPEPKIVAILNKARTYRGSLTRESQTFYNEVGEVLRNFVSGGKPAYLCRTFIPERAQIRKKINFGGFPEDFIPQFDSLWKEMVNAGYI